ncbi:PREDICTED: regulatory protein ADR1 isoform X2 [Trachymyrmex cornetzi]|uniref:regulatory protein ADR1 isoform X2 n=1 Tax=Trachymyrmex cornetzi TaxID=471704 RepID=UPI00084F3110|nr:PREDICTED: regulatory protein ADR1 isoform X2 [Trachymyrmex cornetzi]
MLKTFKCLQCNSTFDRASQLDYHHRSLHLGEKSQICQICGKGFFRKADLRTHLNIHLGTNFYICEICGRKFSHISNLIRHCRMHTGIKPYSCSICDNNFTQMSSLARHKQMIHGIPKDVVQQYYNPSLISNKPQTNSRGLKENKTVDNNIRNRILEPSYIEPKYISQNINRDLDAKNEMISDQRNIDMGSKACLFETIIYVTSKQFGESNLAENESTNRLPQDHFVKIEERPGSTNLSMNNTISNSSQDISSQNNQEQIPFKDSITYLHQLDKNNFTVLSQDRESNAESEIQNNEYIVRSSDSDICISRGTYTESSVNNIKNSLNIETNFPIYNSNEVLTDQKFLHKQISKGIISENKKCNKSLSDDDNQLYIELSNSGMLKFDESRYCNNISLTSLNFNHSVKSYHSENNAANEIICTSKSAMQNQQGLSRNEENLENFSNANNTILNNEEPMLHLVQTETGEQFYEFIISNLVEKMQDASKDAEDTIEYPSNIFKDSQKINSNLKGSEKVDQIEHQQTLDDLVDINNEFNTQFDFCREEKNYAILSHDVSEYFKQNSKENEYVSNMQKKNQIHNSGNLELLENETHVDFDKYVEINLDAFERLNYENCNEKCLEFVEVADIGIESSGYKELSMVRLIQNDGEQLLELLQDSQAEQQANQDFIQANNFKDYSNILQNSNKKTDCFKSKSDFFACVENNVPLSSIQEENMNNNRGVKNIKEYTDSSNHMPTDVTTTKSASTKNIRISEELKKSKTISRKFQCLVCKKTFSTTYNYKQHIGIHFTDQQKFHCKDCGVSFAWKSTLNKHISNNHTSDGPQKFVCEICPKVYSTLSQVHMQELTERSMSSCSTEYTHY